MKTKHLIENPPGSKNWKGRFFINLILVMLVVFTTSTLAIAEIKSNEQQSLTVRGTVTNERGETLVGVTLVIQGTMIGTVTDASGNFQLNVPDEQAVIQFSYVGYLNQNVTVGNQRILNVILREDAMLIEGVVVVGYGTRRQSELSSAVAVVNEQQLQGVTTHNLATMLQGKVPGLVVSNTRGRPGDEATMTIRGVGSIGAGFSPLIVVDGVIGGFAAPQDIASVTVLKDAAATGLYGSRASNGVIIITTKRGEAGRTRVSYSGVFGPSFHRVGNLEVMNSAQLFERHNIGHRNFFNDRVAAGDPAFVGQDFNTYLQARLPSSLLNIDTDWRDLLGRTGHVNSHHIAVSGGDRRTNFYISGNYYKELGTLINYDFERIDFRANVQHTINDMFAVSARINANSNQRPGEPRWNGAFQQFDVNMPWDKPYEDDGVTPYNPLRAGSTWIGNERMNYFYDRNHYSDITRNMGFNTDLKLEARFTDWMTFSTTNRVGLSGFNWTQLLGRGHVAGLADRGRLSRTFSYSSSILTSNLLTLRRSFGDHQLTGVFGQEYSYSITESTGAIGADIVDGLFALGATGRPAGVSGNSIESGFLSYFGQIDYGFMGRYFLVGSIRSDASSVFGANNRWGTFYSIGGSWNLNREAFLRDVPWIDLLRLRISHGTTGNSGIAPYLSLGTFSFVTAATYAGLSGARPARLPNHDLTWETAATTNVGVEFSAFRRLRFEIDVYNRINSNLLQAVPLSAASGFANQQRNVGSMRNRGIDVTLSGIIIDNADFRWESTISGNINQNEILKLSGGRDIAQGAHMRMSEGLTLRHFYMRQWAGVDPTNGDPLWFRWEDANGNLLHEADRMEPARIVTTNVYANASNLFIRSAYPDFVGGFSNNFTYRNFSLAIHTNMSLGGWQYFFQRQVIDADGANTGYNQMVMNKNWTRWENPGDIATHPRIVFGGNRNSNQPSSRYLEDISFFRIQNITLGYDFPDHLGKLLSGIRAYISIDNVAVFTKYSGADPDTDLENPVITSDALGSRFSPTRKILFGLNLEL
jgi:TonB-linked SusC/RagA family outer membrane protein